MIKIYNELVEERKSAISVIICSHNSGNIIERCLLSLKFQRELDSIPWQIIFIDNASTDDTKKVVLEFCRVYSITNLYYFYEEKPGLMNARLRGVSESDSDILVFVDDDNLVSDDFIYRTLKFFNNNPCASIVGSVNLIPDEYIASTTPWFDKFKYNYAIGDPVPNCAQDVIDVTDTRKMVWGAGMAVRKIVFEELESIAFHPLLLGRVGGRMLAGDDSEICLAARLLGHRIYVDKTRVLTHAFDRTRLNFDHLLKMNRGFGAAAVWLDLYKVRAISSKTAMTTIFIVRLLLRYVRSSFYLLYLSLFNMKNLDMKTYVKYERMKGEVSHLALGNWRINYSAVKQVSKFRSSISQSLKRRDVK